MKQTLVLSDIHLSQAHPEDPADPLWMRYRRREHHIDHEFAALVDHVLAGAKGALELVLNGDVLDFDTPWVKDGASSFDELPPTDPGCTAQVRLILADHEIFVRAIAQVLTSGHDVTFLSGNHDIELAFPGVRQAIREELQRFASAEDIARGLRFRAWFHLSSDRLYFEHGSQYDLLNGVRNAAVPFTLEGDRIQPVLGKLAFRRIGARMGYFNPYYEETFYMGLSGYLGHFARFYARSPRHIVRTWWRGAIATTLEILRHRHMNDRIEEGRRRVRAELGQDLSDDAIDATFALRGPVADETMIPVIRELWLDRVGLVLLVTLITALAFSLGGRTAGAIAALVSLGLFVTYEISTPKPDVRTHDSAPLTVLRLFEIHDVRAICLGHTHRPFVRFEPQGIYANSGSWCPAFMDAECTRPVLDGRPVLWITTTDDTLTGGLHWWRGGALLPDPEHARS